MILLEIRLFWTFAGLLNSPFQLFHAKGLTEKNTDFSNLNECTIVDRSILFQRLCIHAFLTQRSDPCDGLYEAGTGPLSERIVASVRDEPC